MLVVDGARFSGSGSIVRQAAAYAAVTRVPVHVVNARAHRPNPGLRHQHVAALRAVRDLVGGSLEGAEVGSKELWFDPGDLEPRGSYCWDVGSAGSTTAMALALLPVLAVGGRGVEIELRGGLFQDFAPSVFHLEEVVAHLLGAMGLKVDLVVARPGYVPRGEGILKMVVPAPASGLRPLVLTERGDLLRIWGTSLASHLVERSVARRMADAARSVLVASGMEAVIEERDDETAAQRGAAIALFADFAGGCRLGADRAGAPRRSAERIGRRVAHQLLEEIASGATVDRFTADQIIPFAALASGTTILRPSRVTNHVETAAWLAALFLGIEVRLDDPTMVSVEGRGAPGAGRHLGRAGREGARDDG